MPLNLYGLIIPQGILLYKIPNKQNNRKFSFRFCIFSQFVPFGEKSGSLHSLKMLFWREAQPLSPRPPSPNGGKGEEVGRVQRKNDELRPSFRRHALGGSAPPSPPLYNLQSALMPHIGFIYRLKPRYSRGFKAIFTFLAGQASEPLPLRLEQSREIRQHTVGNQPGEIDHRLGERVLAYRHRAAEHLPYRVLRKLLA